MAPPSIPQGLPPVLAELVSEAAGQSPRPDPILPGTGGPAGNARLTAWTGLVLLALSLAELVTLLNVSGLISWHVVIGTLLVPPALLKTGSTGWRIVRYYRGHPAYTTAGPPLLVLRLLGPPVVLSTLGLLGTGLALVLVGSTNSRSPLLNVMGFRVDWVTLHQATFIGWAVATGLHVLGRFVPALRLTLAAPTHTHLVPGARHRLALIVVTGIAALVTSLLVLSAADSWQRGGDRPEGIGHTLGSAASQGPAQRSFLRSASTAATAPVAAPAPAAPTRLARAALRPVR